MIDLYFERFFIKEYRIGLVYCHDKKIKKIINKSLERISQK
jgi:hypothetical protein